MSSFLVEKQNLHAMFHLFTLIINKLVYPITPYYSYERVMDVILNKLIGNKEK